MHQPSYYTPSTPPPGPHPGAGMPNQAQGPMGPAGPAGPPPGQVPPPGGPYPPGGRYQTERPAPGWEPPAPIPRRRSKTGIFAVVALLAVGAGVGAFLLLDDDDEGETETTGSSRETEETSEDPEADEEAADEAGDNSQQQASSTAERSPEDTVRGWVQALKDRDCETLVDHMIEEIWLSAGDFEQGVANCEAGIEATAQEADGASLMDVSLVSEEGDHAVVKTVTAPPAGTQEITEQADLYLEDGKWRLDPRSFETIPG